MSTSTSTKIFPGPIALAKEAWEIYTARFWVFAGIFLATILFYVGIFIAAALVGGVIYFATGANFQSIPFIISIAILVLVVAVALIYLSAWLQAAWLLSVNGKEKVSFKEILRHARKYIGVMLITGALSSLLVSGGMLLFLLPGILFSIWFSFSQYIIVNENKKNLLALHTSRELVRGRIWGVIWRWIAVYIPVIILSAVSGSLGDQQLYIQGFIELLSFLAGPFYIAYAFVMYKHLKSLTEEPKTVPAGNKRLYILVPIAGFILFVVASVIAVPKLITLGQEVFQEQMMMQKDQQIGNPEAIQTQVYTGVLQYYAENKAFPQSLEDLVEKEYVESLPTQEDSGFEYRYTPSDDLQGFEMCMISSTGNESCVSYPFETSAPL
ncbi:MAG: hypothetical protein QG600_855 [Patescibacteria group bacterium]|jgi:MFS family permease|nr:hypothetical protein [Patescibacteria group bacterium]